jgi:peptidyl-prolyl cis-trans isomerase SurA
MKFILQTLAVICLLNIQLQAQNQNADKIIAIVSDKIILKSEIESAFADYQKENPNLQESDKCGILEQYISQKMLVEQADRDSIVVTDEEVEGAIENRIRYFVSTYGSEEKLEEMAGKSIYQIKDEYRPIFRDQLIANRMQQSIMANVKITPQEVKAFYDKIPQDSLPFYPSMVEVGQIVIKPSINKEVEDYAIQKLEDIRADIMSGKSAFDVMAGIYSEDPSSKDNGGDLGIVGRDELVPEFAAAAFKLQNTEISQVVKTKFGFHIVQMMNRQGEKAKLRHILIKPLVTSDMVDLAMKKADSVRADLISGKILFSAAVGKYSYDDATKISGGMFTNQQTAGTVVQVEELEPDVALIVNDLKIGEFAKPTEYNDAQTGDKLIRIIYLKNRTEPHKANLKDDYGKIQQVAFAEKQNKHLYNWITEKTPTFYINIDEEYLECPTLSKWVRTKDNK